MTLFSHVAAARVIGKRSECDAVVKLDAITQDAGFANHDTGAVVDEEVVSDLCSRMNVDTRLAVRITGHDSCDNLLSETVKAMSDAIRTHRNDARIGGDDFSVTRSGRVAMKRSREIHRNMASDRWQHLDELRGPIRTNQSGNETLNDAEVARQLPRRGIVGRDGPERAQGITHPALLGEYFFARFGERVTLLAKDHELIRNISNLVRHRVLLESWNEFRTAFRNSPANRSYASSHPLRAFPTLWER